MFSIKSVSALERMVHSTAMIIDDDETLLDVLPATLHLKFPHLAVETFNSVDMASARLKGEPFSVILADLTMPRRDGLQVICEAKAYQPSTPVIAMTGRWDEAIGRTALAKGAYDLLWKPLDREELVGVLQCALMTYRLRNLIDRQNLRVLRLHDLILKTTQKNDPSHLQFAALLSRVRKIQQQSLDRITVNIEVVTKVLRLREHQLQVLREQLAGQLDMARTRANGRVNGNIKHI
jgi:DNA-binding NtrC family response regulator